MANQPSPPIPLLPRHEILQLTTQAPSIIRVRNLQTRLRVGTDAWGRRNRIQPVLISTSIYLRQTFSSASNSDTVTNSTVHYGTLSKAILKSCEEVGDGRSVRGLMDVLMEVVEGLVGRGNVVCVLEIGILLPKGSLGGDGVCLVGSRVYDFEGGRVRGLGVVLKIVDLRVLTIVGVNPNERLAKQIVGCSVEIEGWVHVEDVYVELEQIVFKTIEESSFQTLESLASVLGDVIIKYFIIPHAPQDYPSIRISLEKPTAVTMADTPVVELVVSSDQVKNTCLEGGGLGKKVPFPLQGSLRDWIDNCD